jgi:maleylpyruvate isomerase
VSTPRLVLYAYWRSSASYRVRLAIAAKQARYEYVPVNLAQGDQRREEHLARNPFGYVPCLEIDGRRFVESVAILELIDDLFPEPRFYPRDPFARARVRALVEAINAGVQPLQNLVVLERVSSDPAAQKEWAGYFNVRGLGALARMVFANDREGATGRFLSGDSLTAADLVLVPQLYAARRLGVDLSAWPRLLAAEEATLALPGMKDAAPSMQADAV